MIYDSVLVYLCGPYIIYFPPPRCCFAIVAAARLRHKTAGDAADTGMKDRIMDGMYMSISRVCVVHTYMRVL